MANRSRQMKPKSPKFHQPRSNISKSIIKQPQRRNWLSYILALAFLLGSAGLIVTFAWVSILYIFNPGQVIWLNDILPVWAKIPLGKEERPQTLTEIQLSLSQQKQMAGTRILLDEAKQDGFLLPVLQQRDKCQSNCQKIVELRVYQRSDDLDLSSNALPFSHSNDYH
jgi:hypothetical protein